MISMVMLLVLAGTVGPVFAQQRLNGEDLDILVDSRWAGTSRGGYFPIRIRAKNNAKDRSVTFEVQECSVSPVTRTIQLQSGATTELTILIPMIGAEKFGRSTLEVSVDGKRIPRLKAMLEFHGRSAPWPEPAMLVIADRKADFDEYDKAVHAYFRTQPQSRVHAPRYRGPRSTSGESDRRWITPTVLPRTWLAYSGLDIVSLPLSTLEAMEAEVRDAILGWVETGGTLLVSDVGRPASESKELAAALGLAQRTAVGKSWLAPTEASRAGFTSNPAARRGEPPATVAIGDPMRVGGLPRPRAKLSWPAGSEAFTYRQFQRGRIVVFSGDPMTGTEADWAWFFRVMSISRVGSRWLEWEGRHGMSARSGHQDFLGFTVPGVDDVPIAAFLVLITLFSIVIGPVNFIYLKRRGQLYLLVVTVPVIALVTSVTMIGYATISHGFGIKSHTRSITFLDQGNETAVTMARVALFAGMAPSSLEFSRDTAVYPVWPTDSSFGGASADWTDRQVFSNGWIKTRTRAQLQTVRRFPLRGRINVGAPDEQGRVTVDNGLEWDLRYLYVCDASGRRYLAEDISAGRSAGLQELPRSSSTRLTPVSSSISDHYSASSRDGVDRSRDDQSSADFEYSLLEINVRSFMHPSGFQQMRARSYMAIIDGDPGVERGCSTSDTRSLHVLVGQY